MGSSIDEITGKYGKPYSVKTLSDGSKQYVYIERYMIGDENVEEKRYYLIIKNGKVISKRYNQELPPAYDEIYDDDPNDVPN
jgi:hypothetical protein